MTIDYGDVTLSYLLSDGNVRWSRRMLPPGESR